MKNKATIIFIILVLCGIQGCTYMDAINVIKIDEAKIRARLKSIQAFIVGDGRHYIYEAAIFKKTEAWELAKAVKAQNVRKIKRILNKNPELIDYQDPEYGVTLLIWSIGTERYKSAKALLEMGASVNIRNVYGETALFVASGYSWVDYQAKKDPKYAKLLLEYGADPNICSLGNPTGKTYHGNARYEPEPYISPLMQSIPCGIEKTKLLVEGGADVNYRTPLGCTATEEALGMGGRGGGPEYAYYLIVEKKAIVTEPYRHKVDGRELYLIEYLRSPQWTYPLDSEGYRIKMEIVEEFARQGVDYWANQYIPPFALELVKKDYPNDWEEYIKKF
ncbi:hypothetical protein NO2_0956 [Candidatus Termititenax persephonae]|uniref:Uncharacterized protein n=1 Tax=Candidatus Termititenax persephonae TaxID=2218525 RepID=A0A388TJ06_9BACT|nr:hypothetical protein NO2_0956 [Candidatus Termititenax persephonae]